MDSKTEKPHVRLLQPQLRCHCGEIRAVQCRNDFQVSVELVMKFPELVRTQVLHHVAYFIARDHTTSGRFRHSVTQPNF